MRPAFKAGKIRHKKLTTPDLAVGAVSRAVQGYPNHLFTQVVFCHATRDVGVVVLDTDLFHSILLERKLRAHVERMEVVGDRSRLHAEQLLQIGEGLLEEQQRLVILEIADMLAQKSVTALGETESIF